jgi:glycosyltransferase involved in cell wall biosynthesis
MRILQMASAFAYTGPAEPMLALATDLAGRGHDVTVAIDTVRPHGNVHEAGIAERVAVRGLPVAVELALCTRSGPMVGIGDAVRLRRRMQTLDVVHVHMSHDHAVALAARAMGGGAKLVRTIHSGRSLRPRPMQGWQLRQADAVLVHSEEDAGQLRKEFGLQHVHVIPGSVDVQRYHNRDRTRRGAEFCARHGLGHGPLVLMVAIFQAGRGQRLLLDAWPRVLAEIPDAELAFAGLGELREPLMQRARDVPRVHFLGYLEDDLVDAYAAAHVSVLLAIGNDGYGRAALESLACGTPVVSGDLPPVRKLLTEAHVGWVVELRGGDPPGALAAALVRALREPDSAPRCREAVLRQHTQETVTDKVLAIYQRLLGKPDRGST